MTDEQVVALMATILYVGRPGFGPREAALKADEILCQVYQQRRDEIRSR